MIRPSRKNTHGPPRVGKNAQLFVSGRNSSTSSSKRRRVHRQPCTTTRNQSASVGTPASGWSHVRHRLTYTRSFVSFAPWIFRGVSEFHDPSRSPAPEEPTGRPGPRRGDRWRNTPKSPGSVLCGAFVLEIWFEVAVREVQPVGCWNFFGLATCCHQAPE